MKKWLTLALVLAHLAAFTGFADAQQPGLKQPSPPMCDLTISKFLEGPKPITGQTSFVIKIKNVGTAPCPAPTTVTDTLPTGTQQTTGSPHYTPPWNCSGIAIVTCHNPALTLGARQSTEVVLIRVNVPPPPLTHPVTMKNCATVSNPADPNVANNTFCLTFSVSNELPG